MSTSYSISRSVASGSTNTVNVPFPYLDKSNVHVFQDGVEVPQSQLTWISAGQIRLPSTPTAGTVLTAQRITPINDPPVVYQPGSLSEDALNIEVLHSLYAEQELGDTIGRIVQGPADDPAGLTYVLPSVATRSLKALGFDASGNVIAFNPSAAPVSSAMQPVVAAVTLQLALSALGVVQSLSPMHFGAVGDGVTDDSTAITAMIAAANTLQAGGINAVVDGAGHTFATTKPMVACNNTTFRNLRLKALPSANWVGLGASVRIPIEAGRVFRREVGHCSEMKPATIPI